MLENLYLWQCLFFIVLPDTTQRPAFMANPKKFWYELRMKQIDEPEDITSAFCQLCWPPSTETFEENFRALENCMMSDYNFIKD